jgi:hypothetical protein
MNAIGGDGISVKFFKLSSTCLLSCVACFQSCNHLFFFPSIWKVAIIRLVAKVGTPSGPSDFCPISIVSVLSKAFERILHDQVLKHVNFCNLFSDFKSGFRRGHSTATVLVRVTDDLRLAKTEGKVTVYVLVYVIYVLLGLLQSF